MYQLIPLWITLLPHLLGVDAFVAINLPHSPHAYTRTSSLSKRANNAPCLFHDNNNSNEPTNDDDDTNKNVSLSLFESLLDRFQGDFDNYHQVVEDRSNGLLPREGGGHEQIHCILVPVQQPLLMPVDILPQQQQQQQQQQEQVAARLAAFYFDGIPQRIFRFRYYQLSTTDDNNNNEDVVNMKLYCLNPTLEGQLRGVPDPMDWPDAVEAFRETNQDALSSSTSNNALVTLLDKCDVQWSRELDPVQHAYAIQHNHEKLQSKNSTNNHDLGIHAVMVHGQAIVDSTMIPGTRIRVLDQLSLWQDQFWIHDRGFHPDTGAFVYGNQRGVPYQLERVTNIVVNDDTKQTQKLQRVVINPELQWTLGPQWRTDEEYQAKLDAVGGGVSSQLNKKQS